VEQFMPFMVVPPLGSLGTAYLNISEQFRDEVSKFHRHALRLLESPGGAMAGGTAWADLGFCALRLGDTELAEDVFQKGLNHPSLFILLERARLLSGSALLALDRGELEEAARLAAEAQAFAQENQMHHLLPLTHLTQGKVFAAQDDVEAALSAFEQSEAGAKALNMRPYVWQAQLAAAELQEAAGRTGEAGVKRAEAGQVIQEIAGLLEDENLRQAYLKSMSKVAA
jgi:ATP/maltotriose-dependent transcriptional regulator MalT